MGSTQSTPPPSGHQLIPLFDESGSKIDPTIKWSKDSMASRIKDVFRALGDAFKMGKEKVELAGNRVSRIVNYNALQSVLYGLMASITGNYKNWAPKGFAGDDEIRGFLFGKGFASNEEVNSELFLPQKQQNVCCYAPQHGKLSDLRVKNLDYQKIIIPVVLNHHIMTVVVDREKKQIVFYDPQGFDISTRHSRDRDLKTELKALQENLGPEYQVVVMAKEDKIIPHGQKNRTDCGIIAMDFMTHVMTKDPATYEPKFQETSETRVAMRKALATQNAQELEKLFPTI